MAVKPMEGGRMRRLCGELPCSSIRSDGLGFRVWGLGGV